MNTTIEERKEKAIELMKKLDIYKPYINGFKNSDDVCYFEGFGGFWAWQNPELIEKKKELEEKYNCTVYAITHEITEIGEFYDFLIVTDYKEEWNDLVGTYRKQNFYAFAYVWNIEDDFCSEFGDVIIQSFGGGIRRVA